MKRKTQIRRPQAAAPLPDGALLTDDEAAAILRVESRTLRLWRQTLGLPHIRITPKTIRYRRADLDAWSARRLQAVAL
jgi:hypothetical protein